MIFDIRKYWFVVKFEVCCYLFVRKFNKILEIRCILVKYIYKKKFVSYLGDFMFVNLVCYFFSKSKIIYIFVVKYMDLF